ncbi:hypothetical protein V2J09_016114 [Rumex salicifolius]
MSMRKMAASLPFAGFFRKLEQDVETVIRVLQPGPLGIIEHKFNDDEIQEAHMAVKRAVISWQRRAKLEKRRNILKDYVD